MIQKKHIRIFITLLLALLSMQDTTYATQYQFRNFSPEGGFYYDGIRSIQQDKSGFIWILMDNGLYRFDGYEYKYYYPHFEKMDSFVGWQFNSITLGINGELLIATNKGLFSYAEASDSFFSRYDKPVLFLANDQQGNIWLDVDGNPATLDSQNKITVRTLDAGNNTDHEMTAFAKDVDDFFLAVSGNISRYDYETGKFSTFYSFPQNSYIQCILKDRNKLWVLIANDGLYKIDIPTATIDDRFHFFHDENGGNVLTKTIYKDKYGHLWIATQKGLYILDPDTKKYAHYKHSANDPFSLPNNSVWSISEDHLQNVWLGTYSGCLCYVNLDEREWLKTFTPKDDFLSHNLVSGFAETDKYLWIATEGDGLNCMNKQTEQFTYINQEHKQHALPSDNVKSIVTDAGKNLWIAMFRGGMSCYNPEENRLLHFHHEEANDNSLLSDDLRKIVLEGNSGLWIVYQLNELVVSFYSFHTQTFTHFYLDENKDDPFIFDICRGGNNHLWIMTHSTLYKMDTQTYEITTITLPDMPYLNAQSVCVDGSDNLWIGTIGRGLIRYNTKTNVYTLFNDILKFNVSSIFSLCIDDENNLWMGTNNGMFNFNTKDNKFLQFDKKDGMQGNVYYPLASFKSKTGELYFGGTNGFSIIKPRQLNRNDHKPNVIISGFYPDDVLLTTTGKRSGNNDAQQTTFPSEIVLNHNQTNFGFIFSSDNYYIPKKNRFKFRLRGYDERWTEVDANNRNASFSKVPAGNYTFEILASNNDDVWNETPLSIKIKRQAAPWFSWYAYLTYFVFMTAVLFLILRYYNEQKKLKLQLYMENLDKAKKEEVHQSQLRFFTNISHDFRTPLSLIIGAINKLRADGLQEYYYNILNGNAQRLLNLVNELMDFRTVENGKMPLQLEQVDINHFVKKIANDFNEHAREHHIRYEVKTDNNLPKSLYVDKNIFEKIIMNLVNNAFKYCNDGGSVTIEIYSNKNLFTSNYKNSFTVKEDNAPRDCFAIAIRDTGVGISAESIESVFERFYKVKTVNFSSHLGTGIGLALVKSLVLLHKGTISIYSEREKGSDMIVCFPSSPHIYDEKDFLKAEKKLIEVEEEEKDGKIKLETEELLEPQIITTEKKKVLLVEDNDDLRQMIADYLSTEYEITEAGNGLIATHLLEDTTPDLIISDIMMPEKDGVTLCREVKTDVNTSHIPFVMLTAKTSLESKLEGADSGADLYFEKPVDFNLLLLSVQNIFKRQEQLKEYYAKNYFADSSELSTNKEDNKFLNKFIEILDKNLDQPDMDVNYIASTLSMSRSKLYAKIKSMSGKSIVEFILSYKLRKAARLMVKENMSIREAMDHIGIESQSYFTRAFKKEFGETPTGFVGKHRKTDK